jgi:hypothetical protein
MSKVELEKDPRDVERHFMFPPQPRKADEVTAEQKAAEDAAPVSQLVVPIHHNEMIIPLEDAEAGARVDYGGRPAYVGADVWYIHTRGVGPGARQIAVFCKLHSRLSRESEKWNLSVQWNPSGRWDKLVGREFSETPQEGYWCWPVVPKIGPGSHDLTLVGIRDRLEELGEQIAKLVEQAAKRDEQIAALTELLESK